MWVGGKGYVCVCMCRGRVYIGWCSVCMHHVWFQLDACVCAFIVAFCVRIRYVCPCSFLPVYANVQVHACVS